MSKFYSVAFVLGALVALSAGSLQRKCDQGRKQEIEWAAYSWDVVGNEGENTTRQVVNVIDDVMVIATLGERDWPPVSATFLNSSSMNAVVVPKFFGPCYLVKFNATDVRQTLATWNDTDITVSDVLKLDGTADKLSRKDVKEALTAEPLMQEMCMMKGVINTLALADGKEAGTDTHVEEVLSYGARVQVLVSKDDHYAPVWMREFMSRKMAKLEARKQAGMKPRGQRRRTKVFKKLVKGINRKRINQRLAKGLGKAIGKRFGKWGRG